MMKYHLPILIVWLLAILITMVSVVSFVPLPVQCVLLGVTGGAIRSLCQLVVGGRFDVQPDESRWGDVLWIALRPAGSAVIGWCAWGVVVLGLRVFAISDAEPQPVSTMLAALVAGYLVDRCLVPCCKSRKPDDSCE